MNTGHLNEAAIFVPPFYIVAPVEDNLKVSKYTSTVSNSLYVKELCADLILFINVFLASIPVFKMKNVYTN